MDVSPFAPARFPKLPNLAGLRLGAMAAGERYRRRADLTLMELAPGSTVAGVFTRSTMPGAPVLWCRKHIARGKARAVVINAGNANVFTGRQGLDDVAATARAVAKAVGCKPGEVMVASTGVIGEHLPMDVVHAGIEAAVAAVNDDGNDDEVVVVEEEEEEGTDWEESLRVGCSVLSFFGSIVPLVEVVEVVVEVVGVTLRQALDFLLSVELRSPNLAALSKNDF